MGPSLLFEITSQCDRSCAHCYNVWRHDPSYPTTELSWKDTAELLDRAIAAWKPSSVTILGGEPLLDSRTYDAIGRLRERGVPAAISTHGGHLDAAAARRLALVGVRGVEVSMCSDNGDGASLDGSCRALTELRAVGLPATASLVLARPFLGGWLDLAKRAVAFGAGGIAVQPLVEPRPGALAKGLATTDEEGQAAMLRLNRWAIEVAIPVAVSVPMGACLGPGSCSSIAQSDCCRDEGKLALDPSGNIRHCEVSPVILGNVLDGTIPRRTRRPKANEHDRAAIRRCAACRFLA